MVDLLGILVAWPWLALAPAVLLLALGVRTRRRLPLVAGVLWALYAAYEEAMRRRILCSGECNIRIDLLLLYPVLLLLTVAALVVGVRARGAGRRR